MRDISSSSQFKCTVVSFLPFEVREPKPGMNPGEFLIPACKDNKTPSVLVVGEGSYGIYLDGDRGTLRARTPSSEVARSIFEDFISAQLAVTAGARPALFALPGALTAREVLEKYSEECQEALDAQKKWFIRLVEMADDSWNRYHKHGAITDLMRYAAKALGFGNDRDWLKIQEKAAEDIKKCPACGSTLVGPILCGQCGCVINEEAYEKLKFAGKPSGLKTSLAQAVGVK